MTNQASNNVPTSKDVQDSMKVKFGLKSFLTIVCILLAVMIGVGVLTYLIPAGTYSVDAAGNTIPDTFHFINDGKSTPVPFYRWFSAPIEALLFDSNNMNIILIIALLLVLGGTFNVLDDTGGLISIVRMIVDHFYTRRYLLIWIITLLMMLLSSLFGLQEELLVLFPIFIMFSKAMNWSKVQAISLILITTGVGFTTAILNPFTVGFASTLAGISVLSAIWFRIVLFMVLYVCTSLYLVYRAKQDEKANSDKENSLEKFRAASEEEHLNDVRMTRWIGLLFGSVFCIIVVSSVLSLFIKEVGDYTLLLMAAAFIIGTFLIGSILLKSFKKMIVSFGKGIWAIAPSIIIILLAFSVKYIAVSGNILHTLFYYFNNMISGLSPYLTVVLLYVMVLVIEFFIPGAAAKACLLIPLLTLVPIQGVSINIIILIFLFGDGYTNVLYPTCGTLVIGLSLAGVSYVDWLKKTALYQLFLFAVSLGFLFLAVAIGL